METKKMEVNRFNIDFFEFAFLVEACIPPRPIARTMFFYKVINEYYYVLTSDERNRLFEWIQLNSNYVNGVVNEEADCLWFQKRYDPDNQYKITTDYEGKKQTIECFKFGESYYTQISKHINNDIIINVEKRVVEL